MRKPDPLPSKPLVLSFEPVTRGDIAMMARRGRTTPSFHDAATAVYRLSLLSACLGPVLDLAAQKGLALLETEATLALAVWPVFNEAELDLKRDLLRNVELANYEENLALMVEAALAADARRLAKPNGACAAPIESRADDRIAADRVPA